VIQKNSFTGETPLNALNQASVKLRMHFRKKLGAGFFGGEGFILQKISGHGLAFAELDGEVMEYTLKKNQTLKVGTGHIAMFEPTVDFDIEFISGVRNIFFGGEGLFLSTLKGPGKVWLQTMPIANLAMKIGKTIMPRRRRRSFPSALDVGRI